MLRAHQAAGTIGARALLIHAESATARDFYLHLAEFDPSPTDPLHLVLLMTDIEGILGEEEGTLPTAAQVRPPEARPPSVTNITSIIGSHLDD